MPGARRRRRWVACSCGLGLAPRPVLARAATAPRLARVGQVFASLAAAGGKLNRAVKESSRQVAAPGRRRRIEGEREKLNTQAALRIFVVF